MIKASDLRAMFPDAPRRPLYLHNNQYKNMKVQNITSDHLKFSKVICSPCNSTRTQPYDRSWEIFSNFMRRRNLCAGDKIRLNLIFPYNTKLHMKNIHLYFIKIFGCSIAEYNVPIDIHEFSDAIQNNQLHPNVYLAFGPKPKAFKTKIAMLSDIDVYSDNKGCAYANWLLFLEHITVAVTYIREGEKIETSAQEWHPRKSKNRISLLNVDSCLGTQIL